METGLMELLKYNNQHHYDSDKDEVDSVDGDGSDSPTPSPVAPKPAKRATSKKPARKSPSSPEKVLSTDESDSEDSDSIGDPDELGLADQEEEGSDAIDSDGETEDYAGASNRNVDENENESFRQPSVDLDRVACTDDCRHQFRAAFGTLEQQVSDLQDHIRSLTLQSGEKDRQIEGKNKEIDVKNREIERLKREPVHRQRKTKRTWPHELRRLQSNDPEAMDYKKIYNLCCREENMSSRVDLIHPNLRLRHPTARDVQKEIEAKIPPAQPDLESDDGNESDTTVVRARSPSDASEELFVRDSEPPEGIASLSTEKEAESPSTMSSFPFKKLPSEVRTKILTFVFVQDHKLMHCISRLDPFLAPDEPVQPSSKRTGLLNRFHVSGSSCSVTYAIKPNEHLALFSVCKEWYFIGAHAFYGLNTFAFSSIGEFARFFRGIGKARSQRIQHVELLWIGNQYRTLPFQLEGKKKKYTSRRTWDSSLLCELPRLKSLTVHINETGSQYIRRKHEPSTVKDFMASKTAGQPNFRFARSLRTLQGLDYIHQLRGMQVIRFLDFEKHLKLGGRHDIRDWTFGRDVETVTTLPKPPAASQAAELRNLKPISRGFVAEEGHWKTIEELYNTSSAFDTEGYQVPDIRYARAFPPIRGHSSGSTAEVAEHKTVIRSQQTPRKKRNAASDTESTRTLSDADSTPRATATNSRSVTRFSRDASELSSAGSNAGNPIDIDSFEPRRRLRENSTASTGLFVRQESFDGRSVSRGVARRAWSSTSRIPSPTPSVGREPSAGLDTSGLFLPSFSPPQRGPAYPRVQALGPPDGENPKKRPYDADENDQSGLDWSVPCPASSQSGSQRIRPSNTNSFISSNPDVHFGMGRMSSESETDFCPFSKKPGNKKQKQN
ncbi:hypothetical protein GCG54_00014938 [Colletotrichum gloeosporioides]|uniref:DUF7730 domain-containing protein n=1 Tax=Colletotrichum gloeosporioides TaxID=474922 RepID=A0A8H4FGV2_COLGL|nr:uncharacterized protein GCG54_00014938 [Colletotrichum gloeosporioides]KAF3801722.1 hypothetical protein GCG54_00014938 [Colletotrichum gloeosporioides]